MNNKTEVRKYERGLENGEVGGGVRIKGGKRVPKGYKLETEPTQYPYIRVADFNDLITWGEPSTLIS